MNRQDLVQAVAMQSSLTNKDADKAIVALMSEIKRAVRKGESLTLQGFGTFSLASRAARDGRNPQTGEPLKIPARKVPKFKPSDKFLE